MTVSPTPLERAGGHPVRAPTLVLVVARRTIEDDLYGRRGDTESSDARPLLV
jgi:hypothetical protein